MGTVECYICSHMAIWECCSHMTLSERPILYNYAARMAVVETEIERREITRLTQHLIDKKVRFWLDGSKTSSGWRILDGSVSPIFAPWGPIPTNTRGDCLRSGPETRWYSAKCSVRTLHGGYKMTALCVLSKPHLSLPPPPLSGK